MFAIVPGSPVSVTRYVNVPDNKIKSQMWKKRWGLLSILLSFLSVVLRRNANAFFFFFLKNRVGERMLDIMPWKWPSTSCAAVCHQQDQGFSLWPWNAETMANSQVRTPTDILEELIMPRYMVFILLYLTEVWRVSPSMSDFVFSHAITMSHLPYSHKNKNTNQGFYSLFKGAFFSVHCPFDWFQSLFRKLFQGT